MNLLNATKMQAAWTMGVDPSGREHVVVVAKGTFLIPDDGGPVELAPKEEQVPLVMADTFTGEPGTPRRCMRRSSPGPSLAVTCC